MDEQAELTARVLRLDHDAISLAETRGPVVLETLRVLLGGDDHRVRRLAALCLGATGDARATQALLPRLADPDRGVARAALTAITPLLGPADVPTLIAAWPTTTSAGVRRELALVLGRLAGPGKLAELAELERNERAPEAVAGLRLARARIGDTGARSQHLARLEEAESDALSWLEDSDYISQAWLVPGYVRLLGDTMPLVRVAPDSEQDRAGVVYMLRVCDLAVQALVRLGVLDASVTIEPPQNYPAELRQRLIAGLRP